MVAIIAPEIPAILIPTKVAELIAIGPGVISAMVIKSGMDVKVLIDNSDQIEQYVLSNQIDVGIIEGACHSSYIIENKYHDDKLVLICAKNHPFAQNKNIDLSQLKNESLILREPGSAGREIFESIMTTHGIRISPAWESTSTHAIVNAVKVNLGISVLPYLLVEESLNRKEISQFQLKGITFKRSFRVIYHRNKFLTKSANDFIALCK